ncbi:MAG: AAA-like domain-containing protein [Synechocystis sp.]|nr:AAA-like domain-containing protein [Synechocystis sp.]
MVNVPPANLSQRLYQVGGSLAATHPSYVQRAADVALLDQLRRGNFCYVFNCRQMGKSSLRVRTMTQLQGENWVCVSIDITSLGTEADPHKWYNGIITQLYLGLPLAGQVALKPWLRERDHLSPIQKLREFVDSVVLTALGDRQIAIFIDEIDKVLSLPFSLDDFFSYIRFCYNQRADDGNYDRLSFALFGVATPSDLIENKTQTPFNIGQAIALTGFTFTEAKPLASGFAVAETVAEQLLAEILQWTGGQPFLTQKVCDLVATALDQGTLNPAAPSLPEQVGQLIHHQVIQQWESQDEPVHFRTIGDRLLRDEQQTGRLLGLYQEILEKGFIAADESQEQTRLRLTGVVVKQDGKLVSYNALYQAIFNKEWVTRELNKLRPYGATLQAWVNSNYQDGSRLLRGEALQEALVWASNKNLSPLDYRYLNASQRQEQEASLAANRILTEANQKAKRLMSLGIGVLFVSLAGAAIAVRQAQLATVKQERSQRGTELQRLGNSAQRQFSFDQIPALITALQAAHELQTLVQPEETLADYPATSPLLSLQQILGQIAEKNVLVGHQEGVTSVAISPQADLIASASRDRTVRLWIPQGQFLRSLAGHDGSIYQVAFSPDGQTLATASQDNTVKLWTRQGDPLPTLKGHTDSVYSVSFSPDGQTLASASRDRTVRLWDRRSGRPLAILEGHGKSVDDAQFSPDGQTLVSVCRDGQIRLWDRQGTLIRQFGLPGVAFFAVSWHPDGNLLAVAADDGTVKLWTPQGELKGSLSGHEEFVTRVVFNADGKTLVSSSSNGSIIQWSTQGKILRQWRGYPEAIFGLALAKNGRLMASGLDNNLVKLWDLSPKPDRIPSPFSQRPLAASQNSQTSTIAFSRESQPLVWLNRNNQTQQTFPAQSEDLVPLRVSTEGKSLVGLQGSRFQLWQTSPPQLRHTWGAETGRIYDVALRFASSTASHWIAAATRNGDVWLWQVTAQRVNPPRVFKPPLSESNIRRDPLRSVDLHPTRPELATGNDNGQLQLWQFAGQLMKTIDAHGDRLNQIRYSADGQLLLTGSRDGTAKLWSSQGRLLQTFTGDPLPVEQVAISPDRQWFATGASDGMVRLWDGQGRLRGEFQPSGGSLLSLDFSENSQALISVSPTGTIWRSPVTPEFQRLDQLITHGCSWLTDYLASRDHRQQRQSLPFCPSPPSLPK